MRFVPKNGDAREAVAVAFLAAAGGPETTAEADPNIVELPIAITSPIIFSPPAMPKFNCAMSRFFQVLQQLASSDEFLLLPQVEEGTKGSTGGGSFPLIFAGPVRVWIREEGQWQDATCVAHIRASTPLGLPFLAWNNHFLHNCIGPFPSKALSWSK